VNFGKSTQLFIKFSTFSPSLLRFLASNERANVKIYNKMANLSFSQIFLEADFENMKNCSLLFSDRFSSNFTNILIQKPGSKTDSKTW
jgi:hypothetical protein